MNLRKHLYFNLVALRGHKLGQVYRQFGREVENGIAPDTNRNLLVKMLDHAEKSSPYYRQYLAGSNYRADPEEALCRLPILTKDIIRTRFEDLKSKDLSSRKWFKASSSGSTGEPIEIIQDWEFADHAGAVKLIFSKLAGREIGELELQIWGSIRDITKGSDSWQARLVNGISNSHFINAFRMTREQMRDTILLMNKRKPKLILSYAENLVQLARFSHQENLPIEPQAAVMSTAATLYPHMRETIETGFGCMVYNRYGSREVGDIASNRRGVNGLWIAPWGNYIEIVDDQGNRVPDGVEGNILVTSLTNYAMPLIRYQIGDRGILAPQSANPGIHEQVFQDLTGRSSDVLWTKNGNFVHGGYLVGLLYHANWVAQIQVVQKALDHVVYRLVKANDAYTQHDLDEIKHNAQMALGSDCRIEFEFVDEIPLTSSGKLRYLISEVPESEINH